MDFSDSKRTSSTMNIFYLHTDPRKAAQYHCDKHVVKMIIESAQMLYCAHWVLNPEGLPENAYKMAHKNHPSSIWVRESHTNYMWLSSLAWWLCKEYQFRYGNHKQHKTEAHIDWLLSHPPENIPHVGYTPLRLAMPNEYKREDPVESYRLFYIESKFKERNIVYYTKRSWPDFLSSTTTSQ
jgi:hypothetical protein